MNARFVPRPFASLVTEALQGLERERQVYGLPMRSFWRAQPGRDLSVALPQCESRAATPAGPAAGPHTQLAPNLVAAWLAGARTLELKTVQVRDRLEIPRPCIDAGEACHNVEWSQELSLEESAREYAAGWLLIHALAARGVADAADTHFEASVGYDLAGLQSEGVQRFLATMADASTVLAGLRDELPAALRPVCDVDAPRRLVRAVTLSTFHGCPPREIESMILHLMERHQLNVVVKLNPTLLGFGAVDELLRGRLGWRDLELDRAPFEETLGWNETLDMLGRLSQAALARGRAFGAKLTNTLVVRNTRGRLAGEHTYLSGSPLHPLAITLAARLAEATQGALPLSFSGGVDAENFADVVACGFAPVTSCTDLLRPTGYRRLPRYLKALDAELERRGVSDVDSYVLARSGHADRVDVATVAHARRAAVSRRAIVREAALANLSAYAARVASDPRYHAGEHQRVAPVRAGTLKALDCASCNNCVLCCPNGAFFAVDLAPADVEAPEVAIEGGRVTSRAARFTTTREAQWLVFADACNACGNCVTFCPEVGDPFRVKPRVHGSLAAYEADAPADGLVVLARGRSVWARIEGREYVLDRDGDGYRFRDEAIGVRLGADGRVIEARALDGHDGHVLPLAHFHRLRLLVAATLESVNPVSAMLAIEG